MSEKEKNKIIEEENLAYSFNEDGIFVKEEEDNNRKFLILLLLLLLFISIILTLFIDFRKFNKGKEENKPTEHSSERRINYDKDNDGKCDINCDTNNDGIPDINIDYDGNEIATFNVDVDGDNIPDKNIMNQIDSNGICFLNCDTNGDGFPNNNIDVNGDGICDVNCNYTKPDDDKNDDKDKEKDDGRSIDIKPDDKKSDENSKDDKSTPTPEEDDQTTYYIYLEDDITLNSEDIKPGWSGTQSFVVKNSNPVAINYNLIWFDVSNNFTTKNNLYYSVTRNGETILSNQRAPYVSQVFKDNEVVSPNSENKYVITYEFKNINEPQDEDQNKTFKANIKITTN